MTSTRPRPRLRALFAAAGLTLGLVLAPAAAGIAEAAGPGPEFSIQASINHGVDDYIEGGDFSPGGSAVVTVYEESDDVDELGVRPIFGPESLLTDENGWFFFRPGLDLVPGNYIVTADEDSGLERGLELEALSVTSIDWETNVVSGTGAGGSDLFVVGPSDCDGHTSSISTTVPTNGQWSVDFDAHDPGSGQAGFTNADDLGAVHLFDTDGDSTLMSGPNQLYVTANVSDGSVDVQFFNPDDALTLPADGVRIARVDVINTAEGATDSFGPVPSDPYDGVHFETGLVLEDQMKVVAYDDTLGFGFQTSIDIVGLSFGNLDWETGTATGTAPAHTQVEVQLDDGTLDLVTADENGDWSVTFGEVGREVGGSVFLRECDGDALQADFGPPPPQHAPHLHAYINEEFIRGDDFAYPSILEIDLYDPAGQLVIVDHPDHTWEIQTEDGYFFIELHETDFHLEPGMELVVNDGVTDEKRLVLVEARFESFDPDTKVVTGYAPDLPIGEVRLHLSDRDHQPMWNNEQQPIKLFPNDDIVDDVWSYELDNDDPKYHPETPTYAPTGLTEARVEIPDDDGDATFASLMQFTVIPQNTIQSYTFDGETTVEVAILDDGVLINEDPNTGEPITAVVDERGEFGVATELIGVNLDPYDEVWVTGIDTGVEKHHIVRELSVDFEGIDYENNIVRGTTSEGFAWVEVATSTGPLRGQANGDGIWEATPIEPFIELYEGMHIAAWTADPDMDRTFVEPTEPGQPPRFNVHVNEDSVEGFNWPEGALVHLEILDDLDAEVPVVLLEMDVPVGENDVGSDGNVGFRFAGEFDVRAGHGVTMSDGETTERHIVQPVEVTRIDAVDDVVRGTAEPGDQVWVFTTNQAESAVRLLTADLDGGAWSADFSTPGTGEHDEGTLDLEPGIQGGATESDPVNGNDTEFIWRIPNPIFFVNPVFSSISGHDWTEGAQAEITIDDPETADIDPDFEIGALIERFEPSEPPGFDVWLDPAEFTIEPGHIVTVTDGTTTKTHVVTELEATDADAADDSVSGTAEGGTDVAVRVHADPGAERIVTAAANGEWTADFTPGPDEEPFGGLDAGMYVQAQQPDDDGDATTAGWQLVAPRITADQFDDIVRVDWPEAGVTFDVQVSAPGDGATWTATDVTSELIGELPWENGLFIDLYPDHDVMTGTTIELLERGTGVVIRELVVSQLTVTELDPDDDGTVRGLATPGRRLQLDMGNSTGWAWRAIEVDSSGNWIASPGLDPADTGEEGDGVVEDVGYRFEVGFNVEEPDEDDDATVVRWENYRMGGVSVLTGRDIVVGERWTGLHPATLTIEDGSGDVYVEEGIELDRGPSALTFEGEPLFFDSPEWENHFSKRVPTGWLQPGHTVTISDGLYSESTVVSSVFVTEVDLANDTISGTADPDDLVLVFAEALEPVDPFFSSARFTCSDAAGDWSVSFGEPLVGPFELPCLPEDAQQPLGEAEEIPPFDLDHTTVLRGFASTTDSENPFGNEPDDDDGTIATWWTHLTDLEAVPSVAEVDVDEVTFTATVAGVDSARPERDAVAATVDWGDGAVSVIDDLPLPDDGGDLSLAAMHTYASPAVYEVVLTVEFEDGHVEIEAHRFVVVYDPHGGFVTGGGWIESPEGAYLSDPSMTGQLHFGFNAKYKKHVTVPTGQTNIQFQVADLHFHSDSYDWLIVVGDTALYSGTGSVNGQGGYTFLIRVVDDGRDDAFDFILWNGDDAVYDVRDAPLGGGSIKIHG